ncbi:tripartite tricarboxylate transporter substrate binding protein [Pseudorhodoferax sp. Leaf267]|uniref:Bug family tripartite tricarboxylate transporter substrate binding protein n=1 Tax=Pseudorhodoferax sp. Leaf267 TaxID=1736316 RepID=UPI0006FAF8AD|nr:tripartite tricarboxylate transporter substrate binding protein [Pseudorhodoferax sp. Leaf267]KQP18139.1 twin-arginine translocation pathway signal [Pseudorhodoferax sp. Leaf267]
MHDVSRRALAALALALPFTAALASDYPNKPVRVIIPFPPGGTLDTVGRLLAQKLGEQTGQSFIVDNRPGGNATIGSNNVAKAPADGYTLLFNASTFTTSTHFLKTPPYDPLTDFTPIALVAKAPLSVSVNKDLPITDVKSLVSHAKANPGKLSFAVGSIASAGHFSTELLKSSAGLNLQIVPYKGSAPAYQDLVGGQIAGFVDPVLGATSFYKSGMLKIIAVTSKTRLPTLPEVPTVGETIPGYEFYSWYGLWGPAKLPADVVQKLNAEVNKALAGEMKERLTSQGILLGGGTPDEFARFQKDDTARAFKTIADANIKPE